MDTFLLLTAEGRIRQGHIHAVALADVRQLEVTDPSKGTTTKTTEVSAGTLFDANGELAKLSSGQTDKSQKIAIGALNQESTATNAASVVEGIVGAAVRAAVGK